jgi:two-component system cell cycle response regulator DivK
MRVFTVLVVEDDRDLREVFVAVLRGAGFLVEEAATVSSALALVHAREPDLAILDHDLPDGDGFAIARAFGRDRSMRTLAVTAHAECDARAAAEAAGCDGFLSKPCSPGALVACVRGLLGRAMRPESLCG